MFLQRLFNLETPYYFDILVPDDSPSIYNLPQCTRLCENAVSGSITRTNVHPHHPDQCHHESFVSLMKQSSRPRAQATLSRRPLIAGAADPLPPLPKSPT